MKRFFVFCLMGVLLSGCGMTLKSTEKNISFTDASKIEEGKFQFTSENVIDNMIEYKTSGYPNTTLTTDLEHSKLLLSFDNQYGYEYKYIGLWPVLPLFPYVSVGERNNANICKNENIELNIKIVPNSAYYVGIIEYKLSGIYLIKDGKRIYPLSDDELIYSLDKGNYEKNSDGEIFYSSKLVFPLQCKELRDSELVVEKVFVNKKNMASVRTKLEYRKGSDMMHGIFLITPFKAMFSSK